MVTCKRCARVSDVGMLPKIEREIPGRGGLASFVQVDVMCPGCGALLARTIDNTEIGASYKDTRAEKQAVKVAAAADAITKADAKAKDKPKSK